MSRAERWHLFVLFKARIFSKAYARTLICSMVLSNLSQISIGITSVPPVEKQLCGSPLIRTAMYLDGRSFVINSPCHSRAYRTGDVLLGIGDQEWFAELVFHRCRFMCCLKLTACKHLLMVTSTSCNYVQKRLGSLTLRNLYTHI